MVIHGSQQPKPSQQSTRPSDISDAPLQHRLTAVAPVQYNTPSDAQHAEVVHYHPYREQTRVLPTTTIRFNHRPKLVRTDLPKQEPFCTPHGKIAPVNNELFAKTLQFKLWTLAQELKVIGEIERVCLAGIEPPTPKTDIETRCWDTLGQSSVVKKDDDWDHIPSIWRMHGRRRA